MLMRQGRLEEAINIANAGATVNMGGNDWVQPLFRALEDPSQRERAVTALEEASNAGRLDPRLHMALRVFLGDVDGGMKIALDLASPGMHRTMDMLFLPELRPLREHEDFRRLTEMLGIRDYWDEKGCVWLDDSISCPD